MLLLCAAVSALAQADENLDQTHVFLWQGFEHTWERRVLGAWSVPHRVSLLDNRIVDESHTQTEDGVVSEASFRFAQSTGVDGDLMHPRGYWARVSSPDLQVVRGTARLDFSDFTEDGPAPKAFRRFHELVVVDLPEGSEAVHAVALLQGIGLQARCLDGAEACNSDGLWPYRFLAELGNCREVGEQLLCPLTIELGRAWTPGRGGVKFIEEKPLSQRMSLDLQVDYVVLMGPAETFSSTPFLFENALATNRRIYFDEQSALVPAHGMGRFGQATVGVHSMGFLFSPTRRRRAAAHRGRYIGGLGLRLSPGAYDPATGVLEVAHSGGIFMPRTVASTGVTMELGMTVLQLGHPEAEVVGGGVAEGVLCSDSHPKAPFFSAWNKCDKLAGEDVDVRDQVNIEVRP